MFTLVVGSIITLVIVYLIRSLFRESDLRNVKEDMEKINGQLRLLDVQESNLELRAELEERKKELQKKARKLKIDLN